MEVFTKKRCTVCGIVKLAKEFYNKKGNKGGLRCECISCCKKYRDQHKDNLRNWREKNRKITQKSWKKYHLLHRDELIAKKKKWNVVNSEKIKEYTSQYVQKLTSRKDNEIPYPNKQKCSQCGKTKSASKFRKQRCSVNGLNYRCKKCDKKYRKDNKERVRLWSKKYNQNHKISINKYRREKRRTDLNYKILCNSRVRIYHAVKSQNVKKSHRTIDLIGCSVDFLKRHIESKFIKGMSWNNYGVNGWHIDHISPCALFDLTKECEQNKCFNYSNLQPLWEPDNFKKNSFYKGKLIRRARIQSLAPSK